MGSVSQMFLVSLLLLSGVGTASAQQADEEGERAMFERINALRVEAGLSLLERDVRLDAAARTHSADMAWHQMVEHVSPRTGTPADRVEATGVEVAGLAENVAFNRTAAEAQTGLEASGPHHQNMLAAGMTHVGISVVYADGGVYATQVYATLVQEEEEEEEEAEEAPAEVEEPTEAPTPPPVAPPPPPVAEAPPPPTSPLAVHDGGRVAGYWVHHAGRWWYYPMPPNAQPGQRLTPDLSVTGGPPAHLLEQHREQHGAQVAAPPPQPQPPPRRRVIVRPPPPVYRWRVRL